MVDRAARPYVLTLTIITIYIKIIMWWAPSMGCDLIGGVHGASDVYEELFGCIEIKIDSNAFLPHIAHVECDFTARALHRIDHLFKSHQKIRCTRNWGLVSSTPTTIHIMNHWVAFGERTSFKLIFQPFRLERKHTKSTQWKVHRCKLQMRLHLIKKKREAGTKKNFKEKSMRRNESILWFAFIRMHRGLLQIPDLFDIDIKQQAAELLINLNDDASECWQNSALILATVATNIVGMGILFDDPFFSFRFFGFR